MTALERITSPDSANILPMPAIACETRSFSGIPDAIPKKSAPPKRMRDAKVRYLSALTGMWEMVNRKIRMDYIARS